MAKDSERQMQPTAQQPPLPSKPKIDVKQPIVLQVFKYKKPVLVPHYKWNTA